MNNRGGITVIEMILVCFIICVLYATFTCAHKMDVENYKRRQLVDQSYKHIAAVIATSTEVSCTEMNLRYYHWFKSFGIMPEVVVGKKDGKGHLWLVLEGRIYDATDYHYNGKLAKELDNLYVPAEFEIIK